MRGIKFVKRLEDAEHELLSKFLKSLPVVELDRGEANDVDTRGFEEYAAAMEALKKEAAEDKQRLAKLEAQLQKIKEARDYAQSIGR